MSIDLTKPIEVRLSECRDANGASNYWAVMCYAEHSKQDAEAYRALFQEAPRTKREHAKMLAAIKDYLAGSYDSTEQFESLAAEIGEAAV